MNLSYTRIATRCFSFLCVSMAATALFAQYQTQVVPPGGGGGGGNQLPFDIGASVTWNGQGFVVNSVQQGGAASQAGLERGDIITSVGQQRMSDNGSFRTALVNVQPGGRVPLTVINVRNGQYVQVWLPCNGQINPGPGPGIVPGPGPNPTPTPAPAPERYQVVLKHPITGGVVFSSILSSRVSAEQRNSRYLKYHWRVWQYNGIEEDLKYRRFNSANQAHEYQLTASLLGFYINKVQPGRVTLTKIQ